MTHRIFQDALSNYDPLRLAVYTPATIPLSERKRVGEILFSVLIGEQTPKTPKWFTTIFRQLTSNNIFVKIQELCRGNPVLSAQIAAEIIQSLDKTIEKLIESLKTWIKEQEEVDEEAKQPQLSSIPVPGGGADSDMASSGGMTLGDSDSSQNSDGTDLLGNEDLDDTSEGLALESKNDDDLKSRIDEILDGLALLPIDQPSEEYDELAPTMKQDCQSLLDKSLEESLQEVLSNAKDWESLYELLTAILPGLGWNYSPGFLKHNLLSKYLELAQLLDKIPQLKELANRLGRYHSLMGERVWDPKAKGKSEVFSIERSGDIERILPGELVQLGYPTTKYLFYSKLADKSLLTYELRGEGWTQPEKHEKGPVVICIDTSGSMAGLPESIAKAVSLAITKEANSQSRSVHMILFGSRNETKEFTFDKSENAIDSLLGFLNLSFGGGTDFDSALRTAISRLKDKEFKLADILFVTDGFGVLGDLEEEIISIKNNQGTRIFTLLIESDETDGMQKVSDETWTLHLTQGSSPAMATLRSRLRESFQYE